MLKSPSGKSYVGQTIRSIEKRFEEHRGKSSNCVAISGAIEKYGWENFEKNYYEVPDDDLDFYEEMLIALLGTLSPDGYNLKEGGGNGKPSEETRQKQREAQLGEKNPMFGKTGEKNHNFGKPMSEEQKQKIGDRRRGKKDSEETKQNKREANLGEKNPNFGKKDSEETKQKKREAQLGEKNHKSKRVYKYDLYGTFINSFGSTGEAARELKKDDSAIAKCARGERKKAYGFKWSYVQY